MKIGKRLTLQFCLIVASILICFSISIYYFSDYYQKNQFKSRLRDRAITTARLLIKVDEVDSKLLKLIDKNTNILPKEQVEILNNQFKRIYNSVDNDSINLSKELFNKIILLGEISFNDDKKDAIGVKYTFNKNDYAVLASAIDLYGLRKLENLKMLLVLSLFISIIITIIAGRFYSRQALLPISKVIKNVENITASNLNSRVDEGNKKDEIALLAITFNTMLERLESSFEIQKNFALNISHELRTPLTSITALIEIGLMKERNNSEYKEMLSSVLEDIKVLNELSNGLLDYVHSSIDVSLLMINEIRIDELILGIQEEISKRNPEYDIYFNFNELTENENTLIIYGNEGLLKIAFTNLVNNACKFSNEKSVSIKIDFTQYNVVVRFIDHGRGIPKEDVERIFKPFFRSNNTSGIEGFGLGLPLVEKIIKIHGGEINIVSELGKGTEVTIKLVNKISNKSCIS
jgi:signal transduction histidine kinase